MRHSASNKRLLDYLDGTLGDQTREAVERHIESCEECRHEVERIKFVRRAAALLRTKEGPSRDMDASILSAAKLAATRQRGQLLEKEEARAPFWKFTLRPATIASAFVVLLVALAVIYLPHEQSFKEKESIGQKVALAPAVSPPSERAPAAPAIESAQTRVESKDLKNLKTAGNETIAVAPSGLQAKGTLPGAEKRKAAPAENRLAMNAPSDQVKKSEAAAEAPVAPRMDDGYRAAQAAPAGQAGPSGNTQKPAPQIIGGQQQQVASTPPPAIQPETPAACLHKATGNVASSPPAAAPAGEGAVSEEPAAPAGQARAERKKTGKQVFAAEYTTEAENVATKEGQVKQKALNNEASALMQKAKSLENKGEWAAAAKVYEELLKKYPNYHRQEVLSHLKKCRSKQQQQIIRP